MNRWRASHRAPLGLLLALAACGRAPGPEPAVEARAEASQAHPGAGSWRAGREGEERLTEQLRALEELGYAAGYELAAGESGVTFHAPGRAMPGPSLVVSGHAAEATLIDLEGRVVHRWARSFEDTWPGRRGNPVRRGAWRRAHVLADGGLLAIFTSLGVVRLDRDSNLLWAWDGPAHHDLDVAEDGTVFVLTRRASIVPDLHPSEPVLEDFVTRLSPEGRELGATSVHRLLQAAGRDDLLEGLEPSGDVFHSNAVQWIDGRAAERSPALARAFPRGGVLLSVRQLDLLVALDLRAGAVTWARRGPWHRQHEPVLLEGGTMLVFDNLSVPGRSAVIEFDPLTGRELWSYRADKEGVFFTSGAGTCQRLANGNTLVTESNEGRAFELSPAGEIVWEWRSPHRAGDAGELVAILFDLHRLPPNFPLDWLGR